MFSILSAPQIPAGYSLSQGRVGDKKSGCLSWKSPKQRALIITFHAFGDSWQLDSSHGGANIWMSNNWKVCYLYVSRVLKKVSKGQEKIHPAFWRKRCLNLFLSLCPLNNLLYFIQRCSYLFFFLYVLHHLVS